jgi:hypothetical protein
MSDALQQIQFMLGQIDGKVNMLVSQGKIQDDRAIDLEARVRTVENKQWWIAGVGSAISSIATFLGLHFTVGAGKV